MVCVARVIVKDCGCFSEFCLCGERAKRCQMNMMWGDCSMVKIVMANVFGLGSAGAKAAFAATPAYRGLLGGREPGLWTQRTVRQEIPEGSSSLPSIVYPTGERKVCPT